MKTIFITIYDGAVSKNILRTAVFAALKGKCRVVLFVDPGKEAHFREEFGAENTFIEATPHADHPRFEHWFQRVALYGLHTETIRLKIWHSHALYRHYPSLIGKLILWNAGRFAFFKTMLRMIYSFVSDKSFKPFFVKYRPDLVFTPDMISHDDMRLIKTARRHGVISIGMPKGFDNLTSKTIFGVLPDWLMVQTPVMREEAVRYINYPRERIQVVGFPQFDVYADRSALVSREKFCRSLGLDPAKQIILYGGAGQQLAPHDEEILNMIIGEIRGGSIHHAPQILVRPHPKYAFNSELITKIPFVVIDRPGVIVGVKSGSWEFLDRDIVHLMNSLFHADVVIHTASTLGLEAAVFDRPNISIGFDGVHEVPLVLSTRRYYRYPHYSRLVAVRGIRVAFSFPELVGGINEYLGNPVLDSDKRGMIVQDYAYKIDGKSGERVASFILGKLK